MGLKSDGLALDRLVWLMLLPVGKYNALTEKCYTKGGKCKTGCRNGGFVGVAFGNLGLSRGINGTTLADANGQSSNKAGHYCYGFSGKSGSRRFKESRNATVIS